MLLRATLVAFLCASLGLPSLAQDTTRKAPAVADTTLSQPAESADALLSGLTDSLSAAPLLPDHMLFTQRAVWGKKGLVRVFGGTELTLERREKELRIRRSMLKLHTVMGLVTLAGFVAQGIVGSQLYNATGERYTSLRNLHEGMATAINISYASTALLSLTAPPPAVGQRRGLSTIKLHKYLAIVHMAGMIATNILASKIQEDYTLKPYHRAAAYTTFGAFATAIIVLKF
ncbi:hypothetical protein J2I48_08700 [Fibrella sp. HMF5036]|uniref:Cytochrome b561 domain-containing protein n=2 Tax=Fibrella aquatilis TaxID=2817059 RepID=A0A939G789_9BACT|nr:hypothetical protein [Fibrella aquatilis]